MRRRHRSVVVLALVTASGCRSSGTSTAPLALGAPAERYAVTYRVIDGGHTTTQRLLVNRPFASRVEIGRTERITALGRLATRSASPWTVLEIAPAGAGSDLRVDIALVEAQRRGLVVRRGRRTVAGRRCQLYRTGGAIAGGSLSRARPTPRAYSEFCVARGSIVLEQQDVQDGATTRLLRATDLAVGAAVRDVPGVPAGEGIDVSSGGGRSQPTDPHPRPPFERFFVFAQTPPGFEYVGRYAVVPPGLAGDTSLVSDVYRRGADLLIVDQGASRSGRPPFDHARPTAPIHVAPIDAAELVLDLRANEIRAALPDGGFVRVIGTLEVAELRGLASRLALQPKAAP